MALSFDSLADSLTLSGLFFPSPLQSRSLLHCIIIIVYQFTSLCLSIFSSLTFHFFPFFPPSYHLSSSYYFPPSSSSSTPLLVSPRSLSLIPDRLFCFPF